jgi:hypothetical protein
MPVLEPDPPEGRRRLLLLFGLILALFVVIGVVASIAAP